MLPRWYETRWRWFILAAILFLVTYSLHLVGF